eukprot:m.79651 g.79651  ORF g.79651 m.79651 type:complete len:365 (+) comp14803_c0_seq2:203-1297(+)
MKSAVDNAAASDGGSGGGRKRGRMAAQASLRWPCSIPMLLLLLVTALCGFIGSGLAANVVQPSGWLPKATAATSTAATPTATAAPTVAYRPQCSYLARKCSRGANATHPLLYGVMITGKDDIHEALAMRAISNFFQQDHLALALIVVNDGTYSVAYRHRCICEIRLAPPHGLKLGGLRNVALGEIPRGSIWVQVDDDDWRHPRCLSEQLEAMRTSEADMVFLSRQVQMDMLRNSSRMYSVPTGIIGTVMVNTTKPALADLRFPDMPKGEDRTYVRKRAEAGVRSYVWKNKVVRYFRLIHGHNTWHRRHFGSQFQQDVWCFSHGRNSGNCSEPVAALTAYVHNLYLPAIPPTTTGSPPPPQRILG